jgi:hypothetical protein
MTIPTKQGFLAILSAWYIIELNITCDMNLIFNILLKKHSVIYSTSGAELIENLFHLN